MNWINKIKKLGESIKKNINKKLPIQEKTSSQLSDNQDNKRDFEIVL